MSGDTAAGAGNAVATRHDLQLGRRLFHLGNGVAIAAAYALCFTHEQVVRSQRLHLSWQSLSEWQPLHSEPEDDPPPPPPLGAGSTKRRRSQLAIASFASESVAFAQLVTLCSSFPQADPKVPLPP